MRTAKTLMRLGGCPGWSESSLGAQSLCWFCHVVAHVTSCFVLCFHLCHLCRLIPTFEEKGWFIRPLFFNCGITIHVVYKALQKCVSTNLTRPYLLGPTRHFFIAIWKNIYIYIYSPTDPYFVRKFLTKFNKNVRIDKMVIVLCCCSSYIL